MIDKDIEKLLTELQAYLDHHLIIDQIEEPLSYKMEPILDEKWSSYDLELESYIDLHKKPALQQVLFEFIDRTGAKDAEVYKKAGMDRKLFSKIRTNPDYRPKKTTVIALAIALELSKKDTETLLGAAGYSLSESDKYDLIIQYFIENRVYDLYQVNKALDHFSFKPLMV